MLNRESWIHSHKLEIEKAEFQLVGSEGEAPRFCQREDGNLTSPMTQTSSASTGRDPRSRPAEPWAELGCSSA